MPAGPSRGPTARGCGLRDARRSAPSDPGVRVSEAGRCRIAPTDGWRGRRIASPTRAEHRARSTSMAARSRQPWWPRGQSGCGMRALKRLGDGKAAVRAARLHGPSKALATWPRTMAMRLAGAHPKAHHDFPGGCEGGVFAIVSPPANAIAESKGHRFSILGRSAVCHPFVREPVRQTHFQPSGGDAWYSI